MNKTEKTKCITVRQALELWNNKYPQDTVTTQTIRNWSRKYFQLTMRGMLPRSWIMVDRAEFEQFLADPEKFFKSN